MRVLATAAAAALPELVREPKWLEPVPGWAHQLLRVPGPPERRVPSWQEQETEQHQGQAWVLRQLEWRLAPEPESSPDCPLWALRDQR